MDTGTIVISKDEHNFNFVLNNMRIKIKTWNLPHPEGLATSQVPGVWGPHCQDILTISDWSRSSEHSAEYQSLSPLCRTDFSDCMAACTGDMMSGARERSRQISWWPPWRWWWHSWLLWPGAECWHCPGAGLTGTDLSCTVVHVIQCTAQYYSTGISHHWFPSNHAQGWWVRPFKCTTNVDWSDCTVVCYQANWYLMCQK